MAIVALDHINIIGLAEEKTRLIAQLSKLGAVSIERDREAEEALNKLSQKIKSGSPDSISGDAASSVERVIFLSDGDPVKKWQVEDFSLALRELTPGNISGTDYLARLHREDYSSIQSEVRKRLQLLSEMILEAEKFSQGKKPLFKTKTPVEPEIYDETGRRQNEIYEKAIRLSEVLYEKDMQENRLAGLTAEKQQILPLKDLKSLASTFASKRVSVRTGSFIEDKNESRQLRTALSEKLSGPFALEIIRGEGNFRIFTAAARKKDESALDAALGGFEFSKLPQLPAEYRGNYERYLRKLEKEIEAAEEKLRLSEERCRKISESSEDFKLLYDFYLTADEKLETLRKLINTGRLFVLIGFVPSSLSDGLRKALVEEFRIAIEIRPAERSDDVPVALSNPAFIQPYESIVEMFSLPEPSIDVDPTPVMAPFYAFFFGIMLSDAGYGLLLAGITALLIYRFKVEGNMRKMCFVLFQGGIAAIPFGLLFGSFFGNMLDTVSAEKIAFPRLWFDPLQEPMKLMIASVIFGFIHILVGMGVKFYMLCRVHKVYDAVIEIVPWYLMLLGLGAYVGLKFQPGLYAAGLGAAMVILLTAKGQKNPLKRVGSGLWSLYGVTSYLGDLLSYTRILALTLATSVIAMVVNVMAGLTGKSLIGIPIMLVILILGHALNLALSTLSAYVHSTRLQYVEFFGKFYEGGGRAFRPLSFKTKYTRPKTGGET